MTTLLQDLAGTIDDARQIATDMGARLYRVFVRVRTWTGTQVGDGIAVDTDTEILPRPRVLEQRGRGTPITIRPGQGGRSDSEKLTIDQISMTYSDAALDPTLGPTQELFYVVLAADGGDEEPGLFALSGAPFRQTTQWALALTRSEARIGTLPK